jgi:protein TonB
MAERDWNTDTDTQYMITTREAPKPHEDVKEKKLRRKALKHIPKPTMSSVSKRKPDTPKFAFDTSAGGVEGLAVAVMPAEGMDIEIDDITLSIGDVDSPPRVIRAPPVNPPYEAVSKGIKGRVFVRIRVNVDGKASNIKAIRAEPPDVLEVFRETAEKGVARYRFEPARLGGEAVPVWATQPISFEVY